MALVVAEQPVNQPSMEISRPLAESSEDMGIHPEEAGPKAKSVNALNKKHKTLSLHQKHDLILCRDANPKLTYAELQDTAYERWKVRPSMGALSRLFRKEIVDKVRRFIRLNSGDTSCMRQRPSRVHGLNEALAAWERAVGCTPGNWVTDDQLVAKAKEIGARMELPADFKYSKTNWLAEFKKKVRARVPPAGSIGCVCVRMCSSDLSPTQQKHSMVVQQIQTRQTFSFPQMVLLPGSLMHITQFSIDYSSSTHAVPHRGKTAPK
jgi:hypothetical protein